MFQFASQADRASADARDYLFWAFFFFFLADGGRKWPSTIFACGFTENAREAWLPASMLGYTSRLE